MHRSDDTSAPSVAASSRGGDVTDLIQLAPERPADVRAGAAGAEDRDADDTDYAELADEVYDRIERRLRSELFADLERRGHVMEWA